DYLLKYKDCMRYDEYLAKGFPIATGVIEGACRHLVNDRLGITGARWGLNSAEAVLRLRSLKSSGHFDDYWRCHEEREHRRNHAERYENATPAVAAQLEQGQRQRIAGGRRGEKQPVETDFQKKLRFWNPQSHRNRPLSHHGAATGEADDSQILLRSRKIFVGIIGERTRIEYFDEGICCGSGVRNAGHRARASGQAQEDEA
ncbi:MAG: hypothetical protein GY811_03490, partial [Myxococcales bacterium]|nr:hypothetical protein [Myxococcales bacterium]